MWGSYCAPRLPPPPPTELRMWRLKWVSIRHPLRGQWLSESSTQKLSREEAAAPPIHLSLSHIHFPNLRNEQLNVA